MPTLYKDFFKQSSADNRQLLFIATSITNNASENKSIVFDPEDCHYDSNEWYALSKSEYNKELKALSGRNVWKSTKLGGHYNSGGGRNNGKGKCKSKIEMLEKKLRNHKRQLLVSNTAAKPSLDDEESDGSEKEDGNRKHSDLTH